jgi:hypothetical protein
MPVFGNFGSFVSDNNEFDHGTLTKGAYYLCRDYSTYIRYEVILCAVSVPTELFLSHLYPTIMVIIPYSLHALSLNGSPPVRKEPLASLGCHLNLVSLFDTIMNLLPLFNT